jgi:hypothetical protein
LSTGKLMIEHTEADRYLKALGDILEAEHAEPVCLFVCGAMALMMQDLIRRAATRDIDCAGFVEERDGSRTVVPPVLDRTLRDAIIRVARAYSLPENWLSFQSRMLLEEGLPEGITDRLEVREYGENLTVMLASRSDMVMLKFKAAIGRDKDIADLIEMAPSEAEALRAARWCIEQGADKEEIARVMGLIGHGSTFRNNL